MDVALALVVLLAFVGPSWTLAGLRFGRRVAAEGHPRPTGAPPTSNQVSAGVGGPVDHAPVLVSDRQPGWAAAENAREGSDAWKITARNTAAAIEGYAATTSVAPGSGLALFVSTAASSFVADIFRMGFYAGKRGRLVWSSPTSQGVRQSAAVVDAHTGSAEARWAPSMSIPVGADWMPGAYLVKLVSSGGDQSYVPFTVRDDNAVGAVVVVDAVATWQAYNPWGGCSLYECHGVKGRTRAVKVSFDRPYGRSFNDGSADFLDHELPLIALVEELGIDARYATSVDLHERPALTVGANAVLSLGHDEYYSAAMRQAIVDAAGRGVNLAFFGANAVYRHVRFEPGFDGRADRVEVNYRNLTDPVTADATNEWRLQGKPEASIVGIQYVCAGVNADLIVRASGHWVWAGTGVHDGQALHGLVGNESDGVDPSVSPANLDVLAASPVTCGKRAATGATAYHSVPSGAGVFASGTIWWVCALDAEYCSTIENTAITRTATTNVLHTFAAGPAGSTHPSGEPVH